MASREWGNDVFPSTPGLDAALPRKLGPKHVELLDDECVFDHAGIFLLHSRRAVIKVGLSTLLVWENIEDAKRRGFQTERVPGHRS